MSTILDTIIDRTRQDLIERKAALPERFLRDRAEACELPLANFRQALKNPDKPYRVIAECKKASPSKGLIRPDFDPVVLGTAMANAGAAALSVLTEPHFFQGSPAYLQAVAAQVEIPVLRKDFIVDCYQIHEARTWGASAILLIAAALDAREYRALYHCATGLGLGVLTEVHCPAELEMVLGEGAEVIGVNSRNLKTFEVDLNVTAQLLGAIPESMARVGESGIHSRKDMDLLAGAGADAFLIGELLMRRENPGDFLRELISGDETVK